MKYLIMAAMSAFLFTGCYTHNAGRPGDDTYMEGSNDREVQTKASENLKDVGRQSSPSSPLSSPNGSLNF